MAVLGSATMAKSHTAATRQTLLGGIRLMSDNINNKPEQMDSMDQEQDFQSLFESSLQELHVGDVVSA